LKATIEIGITQLHIYRDSQIIVNQVSEVYNTKAKKIIPYKDFIAKLPFYFKEYQLENILRSNNRLVDAMVSTASLTPIDVEGKETTFTIKNLKTQSIYKENLKMVCFAQNVGYEVSP